MTSAEFKCIICHSTKPIEEGTRLDSGSWRCADLAGCCKRAGIEYRETRDGLQKEALTVARVLARGYGEHIRLHGPDADGVEGDFETMTGAGLIVRRGGQRYVVTVVHESGSSLMEMPGGGS